jgi:beta-glucanase (GH16 family)
MSSVDEVRSGSAAPPPPPHGRRRALVIGLAALVAVALVVVLVVVVTRAGGPDPASTTTTTTPAGVPAPRLLPRLPTEAAVRQNWPMIADDEFDGTALDTHNWHPYTGETTDGVGRHDPADISVADGLMTITSHGKRSGGMAWASGQKYGRWEVRARSQAGTGYSPVMLLWPDSEDWPDDGELDFMEIPHGNRDVSNFTDHYGADNSQNAASTPGDFTQWHNFAVEWAPDHVAGFVDGKQIFRTTDPDQIPPGPMHLAIQQDIGPFENWVPAPDATTPAQVKFQVDWVRIYGM